MTALMWRNLNGAVAGICVDTSLLLRSDRCVPARGSQSMPLRRRTVLHGAAVVALAPLAAAGVADAPGHALSRVRPGDAGWPSSDSWAMLKGAVGGRLLKVEPLLAACEAEPGGAACAEVMHDLKNPYYIGEQPVGTQTSGWLDAWTSSPSAYAVAVRSANDVVAAVNFARAHHLRLIVKGGGHSYLGSNARDSLLVWMRAMDRITLHDDFVGQGCARTEPPVPAVSVEAGARWPPVYEAVTTRAGRYVQGGGCVTVGVAGLVLGNGFGSFSKNYGAAAAGLLEAEIVTADGRVRIVNTCLEPDLFWALKGGGCGSFGVVTRFTLRTHTLPESCGGVFGAIKASSDEAYRRLIAQFTGFYARQLFNRHWGEQASFRTDNVLRLALVFHDRSQGQAEADFRPLLDILAADPASYAIVEPVADTEWRRRSYGSNYERLLDVKRRYDPYDLFVTHHGVGSERWSQDGFTPA
jgi:hypothetical protein